ncbi:MAG TPA: hypothetical protein VIG99_00245 [Myxococcaceae bacterium]|jgi:type IV secretory pathway VirB10-like protein
MPRRRLFIMATLAGLIALVGVYLATDREPQAPAPAEAPVLVAEQVEAQVSPSRPAPAPPAPSKPEAPRAAPDAPGAPGAPVAPPTASAVPSEDELDLPPEQPRTANWQLDKTILIAQALDQRIKRLDDEVRDAERSGDRERAAAQRMLLERSKQRAAELDGEIASLKEQVKAAGSSP